MSALPFVGREAELTTLRNAWADVIVGDPRFLALVGHAGCGKTRLLQAFYAWLSTESGTNAAGYWPDELPITERPSALNPPPAIFRAPTNDDRRAIPWFWWGLGFGHEHDEANSPITAGCGLLQARVALMPHLPAWVQRASRGGVALDESSAQWSEMKRLANALERLLPLLGEDPIAYATVLDPAAIARLLALSHRRSVGATDEEDAGSGVNPDSRTLATTLLDLFRAFFRLGPDGHDDGRMLPCVLVLDDAQWADAETLAFVKDLYRDALAGHWPLMVLCTHAPDAWEQAKQQAAVEDQAPDARTLAEGCQEIPLGPLSIDDLRQLLKQAIRGVTGVHAKKIMRHIGNDPVLLMDLIAYLAANDSVFVHGDSALGFSEDGIERLLKIIDGGHPTLIDARFSALKPEIQALLGHASHQGPRFLTSLLLETGRRLKPGFSTMHLTLARAEQVIVEEEPDLISGFPHHAWHERGKGWLAERQQERPLRSTVLQILSEWFKQGDLPIPALQRYDAVRLLERELTRSLQSPDAEIDSCALLEAVLGEREQLETELGLPSRARETVSRRAQVPTLLEQTEQAANRHGQVLTGHYGGITAIAWDPKERWVATGGGDGGEIIVWSVPTGRPLRQIQTKYRGAARQLAVSPDGRCLLAIFHHSNEVSAWNPATGKLRYCKTEHESYVQSLVVDPQGVWFATASDKWIHMNDLETGDYRWGRRPERRKHVFLCVIKLFAGRMCKKSAGPERLVEGLPSV